MAIFDSLHSKPLFQSQGQTWSDLMASGNNATSIVSNMVIVQLTAQVEPALNAPGSTIYHCASTTNYKTTSATEIKREKKR